MLIKTLLPVHVFNYRFFKFNLVLLHNIVSLVVCNHGTPVVGLLERTLIKHFYSFNYRFFQFNLFVLHNIVRLAVHRTQYIMNLFYNKNSDVK